MGSSSSEAVPSSSTFCHSPFLNSTDILPSLPLNTPGRKRMEPAAPEGAGRIALSRGKSCFGLHPKHDLEGTARRRGCLRTFCVTTSTATLEQAELCLI